MATATKTKKTTKTTVRPHHDKILVRRDEAVGDGKLNTETGDRIPLGVKKGDRVIFSSYAGTEIKLDGDELLIMSEDEILAVID